ncbi:MAG: transcription elongation factor GreA [Sphaerochaetaceae bacterium]
MYEENIRTLLTEEKWTRATLNSYTIPNFQELNAFLTKIDNTDDQLEVKSICDEHLQKNKNSIIALYISGCISLVRHSLDYNNLIILVEMFNDAKKWNIVEYLCSKILENNEDKYILRIMAACLEKLGREDDKFAIYERLVKVDFEEIDLIRLIAERYVTNGNNEKALIYYKKAMQRYINVQNFNAVKDVWSVFLKLIPTEFNYLLGITQRVSAKFMNERAIQLLNQLYEMAFSDNDIEHCIQVLKSILDLDSKNQSARDLLVDCYRRKYAAHGRLDVCLENSNLTQSYRDVHSAIEDFEKNIAFDKGTFVFHKTWNIGRIRELNQDTVIIDFANKRNHNMSLGMAFSSLQVLPMNHIWVFKSAFPKEKLARKILTDVSWGLKTLIQSNANGASLKDMKTELVPAILTAGEWTAWSSNAKKILMNDPLFGFNPSDPEVCVVRDTPISYEEKSLGIFRNEKRFYQKVRIVREFLLNGGDPESEFFMEMVKYFIDQFSTYSSMNDQVVSSLLFVEALSKRYTFIQIPTNAGFKSFYEELSSVPMAFNAIDDSELKKAFIDNVEKIEDPLKIDKVLISLYPYYLTSYIMDMLKEKGKIKVIEDMFRNACTNYRENADLFTYLVRTYDWKFWDKKIKVRHDVLISSELQLLDFALNAIEAKKQANENRRIAKTLLAILFDERGIFEFIKTGSKESAQRVNFIVQRMQGLEKSKKIEVKHVILEKFPDFEFLGESLVEPEMVTSGLLVTSAKLKEKQEELDRVMNVEIPENSKEIGFALALGDLRENSEFKAAKEKQGILNSTMMRLTDELGKATVVNQENVDASKISFGTQVILKNNTTGNNETYQIFGPWESNPQENTISYLAPFGAKLLNHVVGEQFAFVINEQQYDFSVISIRAMEV